SSIGDGTATRGIRTVVPGGIVSLPRMPGLTLLNASTLRPQARAIDCAVSPTRADMLAGHAACACDTNAALAASMPAAKPSRLMRVQPMLWCPRSGPIRPCLCASIIPQCEAGLRENASLPAACCRNLSQGVELFEAGDEGRLHGTDGQGRQRLWGQAEAARTTEELGRLGVRKAGQLRRLQPGSDTVCLLDGLGQFQRQV